MAGSVDHIKPISSIPTVPKLRNDKLPMAGGTDQVTPISNIPSVPKFLNGSVNTKAPQVVTVGHNPFGMQVIKEPTREMKVLPTTGPQLNTVYHTNFDHEVQSSHEEVRRKVIERTTFYKREVEHQANNPLKMAAPKYPVMNDKQQVKAPDFKTETTKTPNDVKPKSLPKRCCIVSGNKQFPLMSNLIAHPHMDHYFVKERTEIGPGHYLAKLVLHHQYLNKFVLI